MSRADAPPIQPPTLADIERARQRIADLALRTPCAHLADVGADCEIHLKLEALQPIGSFKIRSAGNAIRSMSPDELAQGVCTASAGNMAQGVAWCAREADADARILVPEAAPKAKTDAIERLGAKVIRAPFADWWRAIETHASPLLFGAFIHPVADERVVAGGGTIGLEILEDLPDVDAILVPFGGGGLSCGIAAAAKAVRPSVRVYACEVETAAPLSASLRAGKPVAIERAPSFVDGIGGSSVLPRMWPMIRELLDGALAVSLDEIAGAIRLLAARRCVIAEGAGAAAVAAALRHMRSGQRVACVVSGGNIDAGVLAQILEGQTPR